MAEDSNLVTVGITAFDAVETIERAVRSALEQTWCPLEIIVVDDHSHDGTWEKLVSVASKCSKIRVFRNSQNRGVAYSRNKIIQEARGEFIAFFDDDDISVPERIEKQVKRILTYEENFARGDPVVCHTARKVIYPDGRVRIESTIGQGEHREAPSGISVAERVLLGGRLKDGYGACPTCSQMARLGTYRLVGGFDTVFRRGEDTEINIRLAKKGAHFVGIRNPLVIQEMTMSSEKSLDKEREYLLMILDKHRDVVDKYKLYYFCRRWIHSKYLWLSGRKMLFLREFILTFIAYPWASLKRSLFSLPNLGLNRAFSRFHSGI